MKKNHFIAIGFLLSALLAFQFSNNERGSHDIDPKVKTEVLKVLDDYMTTFNAKDLEGWEATYHFLIIVWPVASCRCWKNPDCATRLKYLEPFRM